MLKGLHLKYTDYSKSHIIEEVNKIIHEFESTGQLEVFSSGSTGPPKKFVFNRNQIEHSVKNTLSYFNLDENSTALLSLSTNYVAGKMMVLRAYIGNFHLFITDTIKNPFVQIPKEVNIDFAPFIPLQIQTIIKDSPERLSQIKKILIGGGQLPNSTKNELTKHKVDAYQSFGMAETLTHFALKKINESTYSCLGSTSIDMDAHNRMIINNPHLLNPPTLNTNDIIKKIDHQHFVWKGRYDYLINTGGHKVNPESVESSMLEQGFPMPFFIHKIRDSKWGEKVIIVLEASIEQVKKINVEEYTSNLHPYTSPKEIYLTPQFLRTASQKIKRNESFQKAVPFNSIH